MALTGNTWSTGSVPGGTLGPGDTWRMRPLCLWHLVLDTGEGVSVGWGTGGWWVGSLTSQRRCPGSQDVDVAFPHSPTSLTERNGLTQVTLSKKPADRPKGLAASPVSCGDSAFLCFCSLPSCCPSFAWHLTTHPFPSATLHLTCSQSTVDPGTMWRFGGAKPHAVENPHKNLNPPKLN